MEKIKITADKIIENYYKKYNEPDYFTSERQFTYKDIMNNMGVFLKNYEGPDDINIICQYYFDYLHTRMKRINRIRNGNNKIQ